MTTKPSINFIPLIAIGAIATALYLGRGNLAQHWKTSEQLRAKSYQTDVATAQAELDKQALEKDIAAKQQIRTLELNRLKEEHEIARDRYMSNCRVPAQGVAVAPGMELVDPQTGFAIPDGTLICDSSGNTGVMRAGRVADFARLADTPKSVLSRDTFDRYFSPVQPAAPSTGRI